MAAFGARLRLLRKERDMTQKELGRILGITGAAVSAYEKEINEPGYEMLFRIASYFQVSVPYVLGLSDDRSTPDDADADAQTAIDRALSELQRAEGLSETELLALREYVIAGLKLVRAGRASDMG